MAISIRVRCPVCGLLGTESQFEDPERVINRHVEIVEQKFGGKLPMDPNAPYIKHGIGKAPGYMEYSEDLSAQYPEKYEKWTKQFAEWVIEFGKANGLIE